MTAASKDDVMINKSSYNYCCVFQYKTSKTMNLFNSPNFVDVNGPFRKATVDKTYFVLYYIR